MTTKLTMFQRMVLRLFHDTNAVWFAGAYVFARDVRNDPRLAELMYWSCQRNLD